MKNFIHTYVLYLTRVVLIVKHTIISYTTKKKRLRSDYDRRLFYHLETELSFKELF